MEVSGKLADVEIKSIDRNFQFCDHCQFENVTTEAKGICRECEEYMCHVCFRNHLKGKRNRTHELINVSDPEIAVKKSAREAVKCQQHDDEIIKFFCREHEAVGCGDCLVLEHSACKPEYIKDLSKGIQETEYFKYWSGKLEQLDCDNKANHEKIENNRRECMKKHEIVLKEIRKYRNDINTYLDQAEAAIISEAKQLWSETENLLDQLENDWKDLASKIKCLEQKLDTTVHKNNELFIQVVRNKANIVVLEQEIAKHAQRFSKIKIKHYDFVPDKQLDSQMKSNTKLGNLKFSYPNKSEREEISEVMEFETDLEFKDLTIAEPLVYEAIDVKQTYVAVGAHAQRSGGMSKREKEKLKTWISKGGKCFMQLKHDDFVPDKQLCNQMEPTTKLGNLKVSFPNKSEREEASVVIGRKTSYQTRAGNKPVVWDDLDVKKTSVVHLISEPVVWDDLDVKKTSVVVGVRVRRIGKVSGFERKVDGVRGTVTAVDPDGSFSVKWDLSGETFSGYRIGRGYMSLELV